MIIDTYVYFVSYKLSITGLGDDIYITDSKINSEERYSQLGAKIHWKNNYVYHKDGILSILNIQLLDSYNKEESEAKDEALLRE